MVDRVCPQPREVPLCADNAPSPVRPSYAVSLEQLETELNELGVALDQLDKHI